MVMIYEVISKIIDTSIISLHCHSASFISPLILLDKPSFVLAPSILSSGHQRVSWGDVRL